MKNSIKVMAVIAALCLTACGSTDSSAEDSGKLTLASSTTTTAAATEASADATTTTEAETTTTATTAETTKETKKETTKETTKEATEESVDEADSSEAPADPAPTAPEPEPVPVVRETKFAVTYNGVTFNVGDTFSAIEQSLGKQSADPQQGQACVDDAPDSTLYYYPQLTIEVNNDKIIRIEMGENMYYGDQTAKTAKGAAIGGNVSDLEAAYGKENDGDGYGFRSYYDAETDTYMDVVYIEDEILSISVHVPFN